MQSVCADDYQAECILWIVRNQEAFHAGTQLMGHFFVGLFWSFRIICIECFSLFTHFSNKLDGLKTKTNNI